MSLGVLRMPLFSLGLLAFLLGGCAAVAVVGTAASVTTTAVKTTAKGVGAVGRVTYRGARSVVTSDEKDGEEPGEPAAVYDDEPLPISPRER